MDEFYTERLYIRRLNAKDYFLAADIFMNEAVMRYALLDCVRDDVGMRSLFRSLLETRDACLMRYSYLVFLKSDGIHVGFADFEVKYGNGRPAVAEIGYFFKPEHWGNGYATETARKLLEICFRELDVRKVNAGCNALNADSENVMKKIGMKKEGDLRLERYKNGEWCDELRYGILKDEWLCR